MTKVPKPSPVIRLFQEISILFYFLRFLLAKLLYIYFLIVDYAGPFQPSARLLFCISTDFKNQWRYWMKTSYFKSSEKDSSKNWFYLIHCIRDTCLFIAMFFPKSAQVHMKRWKNKVSRLFWEQSYRFLTCLLLYLF